MPASNVYDFTVVGNVYDFMVVGNAFDFMAVSQVHGGWQRI